jgi:hypothetical protein
MLNPTVLSQYGNGLADALDSAILPASVGLVSKQLARKAGK